MLFPPSLDLKKGKKKKKISVFKLTFIYSENKHHNTFIESFRLEKTSKILEVLALPTPSLNHVP